jgi:hypothetical protein
MILSRPFARPNSDNQSQFIPHRTRRAGHVRHFRRPLRRRNADAADPRTGAGNEEAKADPAFRPSSTTSQRPLHRPSVAALFRRAADRATRRREDLLQARRAQPHRQRTRSTIAWARSCLPAAWARPASSPKPAPASMAWQLGHGLRPLRLECEVYMGETDVERQAPNVFRMKLLGAKIVR